MLQFVYILRTYMFFMEDVIKPAPSGSITHPQYHLFNPIDRELINILLKLISYLLS